MSYDLRSYSGKAQATTLSVSMSGVDSSFTLTDVSTWLEAPTYANELGTSGTFVVSIGYGSSTEEKILCSAVDLGTGIVTVATRGYDGSTVQTHAPGDIVMPVFSAQEALEANYVTTKTVKKITAAGDLLVGDAANSLTNLPKGSNGAILKTVSGSVGWSGVGTSKYILQSTGSDIAWITDSPPSMLAWRDSGTPSTTAATWEAIPFLNQTETTGITAEIPELDATTNKGRIKVHKTGLYQINAVGSLAPVAASTYAAIRLSIVGGNTYLGQAVAPFTGIWNTSLQLAIQVYLSAGDQFDIQTYCDKATTWIGGNNPYTSYCSLAYLGAAS